MINCKIDRGDIKMNASGSLTDVISDTFHIIAAIREGLSKEDKKAYIIVLRLLLSGMESGKLEKLLENLEV